MASPFLFVDVDAENANSLINFLNSIQFPFLDLESDAFGTVVHLVQYTYYLIARIFIEAIMQYASLANLEMGFHSQGFSGRICKHT